MNAFPQRTNINLRQNNELGDAINGAKALVDKYVKYFNLTASTDFFGYQQIYFSTNELISEYIKLLEGKHVDNALSVTSSGDHAFNLITEGVLNIDTFDVNKLTEYFAFGIKKTMILKYDYKTYLKILKTLTDEASNAEKIYEIITDLLPFMDLKYRLLWREVLDYNYKLQKNYGLNTNIINILCTGIHYRKTIINNNNYLLNEENYNKLKSNLLKANLSFTYSNATELSDTFKNKKYDVMLLSNILDYFKFEYGFGWKINKLNHYLRTLEKITEEDALIFLHYIYLYKYLNPNYTYSYNSEIILDSNIQNNDLRMLEIKELYNGSDDIPAMILKRG